MVSLGDVKTSLQTELKKRFPNARISEEGKALQRTATDIVRLVENPNALPKLDLDIEGTDFQKRVWKILRGIPAGKTLSYTDIAVKLKIPHAVRAVAQACATNKLALLIPCHRVIKKNGSISGYRWGVARKRKLLQIENRAAV